jgi:hypothetical protein
VEINYKVSRSKRFGYAAYIYDRGIIQGKPNIFFGGRYSSGGLQYMRAVFTHLEDNVEGIITHEFMHILLYDLTGGMKAVKAWDCVDGYGEITQS